MVRSAARLAISAALFVWFSVPALAQQRFDVVVPASTKAFVYTPSFTQLTAHWRATDFGQLYNHPALKAFRDDLERQLNEKQVGFQQRMGLSLEELANLAAGEVAIAMIPTKEMQVTLALLANVQGNEAKAQQRIDKMTAAFTARGGTKGVQPVEGVPLTMFNLPPQGNVKMPQVAYCLRGSLLLVTDNIGTAATLLRRLARPQPGLDSVAAYRAVISRAAKQNPFKPDLIWFVDPVGMLECIETDHPHLPGSGPDPLKIAKDEGFTAIVGVGGLVSLAAGPYGAVHRTSIYAPPPYQRAMRMAAFPNSGTVFKPHAWVPPKISTWTTFNWDMQPAFDAFYTLFDATFGDGEEGVFADMLRSLREDPNGPQVDLRKDLVALLGRRATVLTDVETPITPQSQCRIFAAESVDPAALAKAIDRLMRNDPGTKKHEFQGHTIYEMLPEEDDAAAGGEEKQPARKRPLGNAGRAQGGRAQGGRFIPNSNSAVAVAYGTLFVSTHVSFLQKVLATQDSLAKSAAYQHVEQHLQKLGANNVCLQEFSDNAQRWYPAYELFRTNRLPESDLFVASILNRLFPEAPEGEARKQQIDGSKLPNFSLIRQFLGTGGAFSSTEPSGWFIIGFTLNAGAQQQANQPPKAAALQ